MPASSILWFGSPHGAQPGRVTGAERQNLSLCISRTRHHVLCCRRAPNSVIPCCGATGRPLRSAGHDGVHPSAIQLVASSPWRSRRTCRRRSPCYCYEWCCHRWTCRRDRRTSWPWSTRRNAPRRRRCQHRPLSRPPIGPLLAGTVQTVGLGAPFVLAGTIKSIYDLVLSRWFRTVPLPEQIPP